MDGRVRVDKVAIHRGVMMRCTLYRDREENELKLCRCRFGITITHGERDE